MNQCFNIFYPLQAKPEHTKEIENNRVFYPLQAKPIENTKVVYPKDDKFKASPPVIKFSNQ